MSKKSNNLKNIKYIPPTNEFALVDYINDFKKRLNQTVYEINTEKNTISLIFLERHLPHIMGLQHYVDKKSKNLLMRNIHNLKGQEGFNNMEKEAITFNDLKYSRKGKNWKDQSKKKRIISIHLISDMIKNSELYYVCGKIKGKIYSEYLLRSIIDNTRFYLCVDKDTNLSKYDKKYCCITELINSFNIDSKIKEEKFKNLKIKNIVKKDFYSDKILEVYNKEHLINQSNPYIVTRLVNEKSLKYLLNSNCTFNAIYLETQNLYQLYYYCIDKNMTKILEKVNKKYK